jgi:class 3 adenylate cyclase
MRRTGFGRCPAAGGHAPERESRPARIEGNGSAASAAVLDRDPRSYTPRHLAEKILRQRSAIEGERKQVTVLFADVRESMDLAERVDPETWHGILDGFFQILTNGVHRFEGTVNQYTGDGIMALFGAPIAHEDHAHRACYAALHLIDDIAQYADELRRQRGLNFSVRIGINSGDVVVGKIGDDLRMDYTAQGHTVGLAARVEQLAAPNAIYLTEHTGALVTGYFRLHDLGDFQIKGVREPIALHRLDGVGTARSRLDVSARADSRASSAAPTRWRSSMRRSRRHGRAS